MLELNGYKYSKESFPEYRFRAKVKIDTVIGLVSEEHQLDIYTTDPSRQRVEDVLNKKKGRAVVSINIFHWCTKEQDDAASIFIDEVFKNM